MERERELCKQRVSVVISPGECKLATNEFELEIG